MKKVMNNVVFAKNYEKCDIKLATTEITRNFFSIKTKLSYYKVFHRKFISNRNKENSDTDE